MKGLGQGHRGHHALTTQLTRPLGATSGYTLPRPRTGGTGGRGAMSRVPGCLGVGWGVGGRGRGLQDTQHTLSPPIVYTPRLRHAHAAPSGPWDISAHCSCCHQFFTNCLSFHYLYHFILHFLSPFCSCFTHFVLKTHLSSFHLSRLHVVAVISSVLHLLFNYLYFS